MTKLLYSSFSEKEESWFLRDHLENADPLWVHMKGTTRGARLQLPGPAPGWAESQLCSRPAADGASPTPELGLLGSVPSLCPAGVQVAFWGAGLEGR